MMVRSSGMLLLTASMLPLWLGSVVDTAAASAICSANFTVVPHSGMTHGSQRQLVADSSQYMPAAGSGKQQAANAARPKCRRG